MAAQSRLTREHALYIVIFILALALRFGSLGALPLSEAEAGPAWRAYQLTQGEEVQLGDQPAYVLLTAVLFYLLPSSEFLARFWPALFGLALVAAPFFLRALLGRRAALVLAFGLALDPGMVAVSRLAGGHMIAVASIVFTWLALRSRQAALAGVLAVVALAGASTIYIGLLALGLAWMLVGRSHGRELKLTLLPSAVDWRTFGLAAVSTWIAGLTFLMALPQGLAGPTAPLADLISIRPGTLPAPVTYIPLALLAYGLAALVFGTIGAWRVARAGQPLGRLLAWWALAALVLVLLYPGRQVLDLLWVLLPLWTLAAIEFSRYLEDPKEERAAVLGQMALILLLAAFLTLNLAELRRAQAGSELFGAGVVVILLVIALGVVATILINLGWSRSVAAQGTAWAAAILLVGFSLAAAWRLVSPEAYAASDLWNPGPAAGQAPLLASTISDLSEMAAGEQHSLAVDVQSRSASLAWALRHFPAYEPAVGADPIVIVSTVDRGEPISALAYRGQSFDWLVGRDWLNNLPGNLISWLLYRESLATEEQVILWAREDIFPSAQDQAAESSEEASP